jgi:phenylpropionate dioxygenase-like ring-hydroxylating dioxygenase large terminal subunit
MELKTLLERDGKLRENWYIACLADELRDRPLRRELYDMPLVLFRDGNQAAGALLDRCAHRAAILSEGEVRNGRLACPYHGWEYNREGKVERIPSEDPQKPIARHLCQQSFPCLEQDGVIWVWMGEAPPTAEQRPWRFPHHADPEWEHYFMITDFPNEVTNLAENFMDVPHTVYVHRGWFRDEAAERKPIPATVSTQAGRVLVTYHQEKDEFSLGARLLLNPHGAPMQHTDEYIFPNITCVRYSFNPNGFIINSQVSPVSTMNSRVYTYIAYRIPRLRKVLKPVFRFYTRQVIEQDVVIMDNQSRSFRFDPRQNFRSTECDEVHVAIERLRHWGVSADPRVFEFNEEKRIHFWI